MRLLFDENLSPRLVGLLAVEFPGSVHVRNAGLAAASEPIVWSYAAAQGLVIVSKDSDFQYRATLLGHPPNECRYKKSRWRRNVCNALPPAAQS